MSHWDDLCRQARARRAEVLATAGQDPTLAAAALLQAADRATGLNRVGLAPEDGLLDGAQAVLDPEAETIWFNREVSPRLAAFYQAHEYAHFWLHQERVTCAEADLDGEAAEEPSPYGAQRVEGYSPHERREREANVFAAEFLLPADALRDRYLAHGLDAPALVARAGLPEGLVVQQLARALLVANLAEAPRAPDGAPDPSQEPQHSGLSTQHSALPAGSLKLDPSQEEAAHVPSGPLLVEAGPGTGKTHTLVGRILFLLGRGVPPTSLLALTFSNKAAESMRARVAQVAPEAATGIWMGTFHAFGLELLRRYGTHLGLPPKPSVLDPIEALFLLERVLPELALDHYQNLYEPTVHLGDLLAAISRAKDELVGPERYAELAEQMRERATSPEATEATQRALEVARAYAVYQARLEQEGQLDFGDLLFKSVRLLREQSHVRAELRRRFQHVLVDEYQDVNRASGLLLREVAGKGRGLWVVGDARQAIYRFRGAAPANLRLFPQDFPGARVLALRRNYRSQPAIVDVFAELAPRMRATHGQAFTPWEPARADRGARVCMEVAEDGDAEGDGLAQEIERQRAAGIPYRDQAVLCRSHTTLARMAERLERAGVPALYLGDLFERPEVRDLLALVSLVGEADGRGLVRVARFPEYQVPLADVRVLLGAAYEAGTPFPEALRLARDLAGLSPGGRAGLSLLEQHLEGLDESDPWRLLARYLFARGGYVRALLADRSLAGQQRRLALYQFLQFVREQRPSLAMQDGDPRRALLRHVRRLELFGEERTLRQVPDWASGLDAVRLLTVHASKGLEFRAVYVPGLAKGAFPASRRARPCPPPEGMLPQGADDEHEAEEECLFFVALSRARDVLCLSRARRQGQRNTSPSELLQMVARQLPQSPDGPPTWRSPANPAPVPAAPALAPGPRPTFLATRLDVYLSCPRQYYYEYVLDLSGKREDSAYVQFHRCVYAVLRWLEGERAAGRTVVEADAQTRLAETWAAEGPREHPYEAEYWRAAEAMVRRAVQRYRVPRGKPSQPEWEVTLPHGHVRFRPDHVETSDDGEPTVTVQRLRTGRPTASELQKDLYALYQAAAEQAYPRAARRVEVVYLSTDEVVPVSLKPKTVQTRLAHYDAAMAGILRGTFPPRASDRDCPRCPHYFICPAPDEA